MKTLIAYFSETGNTRMLAQEIYTVLDGEITIDEITEINNTNGYDLIYIGFPIHNFGPPKKAIDFIAKLTTNQKTVLFATHAMPKIAPMYTEQIENCKKVTEHLNLLGVFSCMGELSETMAEKMIQMDNPQLQSFGKMRKYTIGHPNQNAMEDIRTFIKEMQKFYKTEKQ